MKGIIFTEFVEMLEDRCGAPFADDVLDEAGLESGGAYTSVGTYDAAEFDRLVALTAARLGQSSDDVLRDYGQYLFGRLARQHAGMVDPGSNALTFVTRLSRLHHDEVAKLYDDSEVPQFEVVDAQDDSVTLLYRSQRSLGSLAEGLLHGVIAHFGQPVALSRATVSEDDSVVRFVLTRLSK